MEDLENISQEKTLCKFTSLMRPNFEKIFSISRRVVRGFSGDICTRYPDSPSHFRDRAARPLKKKKK